MLFFLIPFAMYLMVYSYPLSMVYCTGKFDFDGVALVSDFLRYLAISLPLYGTFALMQKSFSALMDMRPYSRYCLYSAIAQVAFILVVGIVLRGGMPAIALSTLAYYVTLNVFSIAWLRRRLGGMCLRRIAGGAVAGLVLGGLGAAVGAGGMWALEAAFGSLEGSVLRTLGYIAASGILSLAVTFGAAVVLKVPEAKVIRSIAGRFTRR